MAAMDLDAYSAAHRQEWDRLDALGKQRFFSGPEADELIDRYVGLALTVVEYRPRRSRARNYGAALAPGNTVEA